MKLYGGVVSRTKDLRKAQRELGTGSASTRQAIIPMKGAQAGDPHSLSKKWNGGSMYWNNVNEINAMRDTCARTGTFEEGSDNKICLV